MNFLTNPILQVCTSSCTDEEWGSREHTPLVAPISKVEEFTNCPEPGHSIIPVYLWPGLLCLIQQHVVMCSLLLFFA